MAGTDRLYLGRNPEEWLSRVSGLERQAFASVTYAPEVQPQLVAFVGAGLHTLASYDPASGTAERGEAQDADAVLHAFLQGLTDYAHARNTRVGDPDLLASWTVHFCPRWPFCPPR